VLRFGEQFNKSVSGLQLPASLRSLVFGARFNQPLHELQLPASLHSLTLGGLYFNQPPACLPKVPAALRVFAAHVQALRKGVFDEL